MRTRRTDKHLFSCTTNRKTAHNGRFGTGEYNDVKGGHEMDAKPIRLPLRDLYFPYPVHAIKFVLFVHLRYCRVHLFCTCIIQYFYSPDSPRRRQYYKSVELTFESGFFRNPVEFYWN